MADQSAPSPTHTDIATFIRQLWQRTLQLDAIDERRDFFEAGGDSMSMVHMLVAVTNEFDCELDYEAFVKTPTLAVLEALVNEARNRGAPL